MKLKTWRIKQGLSQPEMADLIGVASRVTIARYEAGDRMPEEQILRRIIEATGGEVTANDFFGLTENEAAA